MPAYDSPSFPEIFVGTTADTPRVYLDVEECLSVNILDLVDPWLQFFTFEDGRGIWGHD